MRKTAKSPWWLHAGRLLLALFIAAVFLFLFRDVARGWRELRRFEFQFSLSYLLLSGFFFGLAYLVLALGWRSLVSSFGFRIPVRSAFRLVVQSSLGHYLPGKFWAPASLVFLGSKWGIPVASGAVCAVASTALVVVAGLVFSGPWVIVIFGAGSAGPLAGSVAALVLGAAILHPRFLNPLVGWILERLVRPPSRLAYSYGGLLKSALFYLVFWLAMGLGFVLALKSVVEVETGMVWGLMSIHALSYSAGVAAVFAPAGLGVREGIAAYLLGGMFSAPLPALLSIYGRLWSTALEGLVFLVSLCFPALPPSDPSPEKVEDGE